MRIDTSKKPTIAVHKFSSCDGCQLAFLNAGKDLLKLAEHVDVRHFLEAGFTDEDAKVDISFVEGSVSTDQEIKRIDAIRRNSQFVVAIGACATSGGLQALRNLDAVHEAWKNSVYANPEVIRTLEKAEPPSKFIRVDLELWGCPVDARQVFASIEQLLLGVKPVPEIEKLCLECKRQQTICVMVAGGHPCLGPVTRGGCGALCPRFGRDCYACFGPAENPNTDALARRLEGLGLHPAAVARRFLSINSQAPAFLSAGVKYRQRGADHD